MSRLSPTLALLVLAGASGCNTETGTVSIIGLYQVQTGCKNPVATSGLFWKGSLDYAVDPIAYYVGVRLQANMSAGGLMGEVSVGGTVLEPANRDVPIITEKVLTYTSTPNLSIPEYHQPVFLPFDFGATVGLITNGGENLISTQGGLGRAQANELIHSGGGLLPIDLRVNLEYRGHMSRSGALFTTGTVTAPISLTSVGLTAPACAILRKPVDSVCLSPGQDAQPLQCCDGVAAGSLAGCP
jgi:hypothetical protein